MASGCQHNPFTLIPSRALKIEAWPCQHADFSTGKFPCVVQTACGSGAASCLLHREQLSCTLLASLEQVQQAWTSPLCRQTPVSNCPIPGLKGAGSSLVFS